ncbi:MAG: DUF4955 domain-containing protein [Opitutaceae bacterium]|nr:DUF4955 domain-containing protein [Opitutaceae bacterium]
MLPDFSRAGYHAGEIGIPDAFPRLATFDVTAYGAVPDDTACDQAAIERAVRAAEAAGGGVVFFPRGEFLVNSDPENTRGIVISRSNIVLKGSGSGPGGTVIFMVNHMRKANPQVLWGNEYMFTFKAPGFTLHGSNLPRRKYETMSTLAAPAARGSSTLELADVRGFAAGDRILAWSESARPAWVAEQLQGREPGESWERIRTRGVAIQEMSRVVEVLPAAASAGEGPQPGKLVLAIPLSTVMHREDGWLVSPLPYIEECGFEDIHFRGNFQEEFVHHKNYIHNTGWQGVKMLGAINSWVRRCVFTDVNGGVILEGTLHCSILLNRMAGNRGHTSFSATFGGHNLIGCNTADEDRGGVNGAHGAGASHLAHHTVVWRYRSAVRGLDFHGTFPRNTLSDCFTSDVVTRHGGNYKDLPNHMGGLVIWNFRHTGKAVANYDFWNLQPRPGSKYVNSLTALDPVVVGLHGARTTIKPSSARVESEGRAVEPESLYEAQLRLRLGHLPPWVDEVKAGWERLLRQP